MKILLLPAALAASVIAPAAASAQSIPAATIAVVDLDKVSSQCNACRTAQATLQGQVNALKARETALATPLQTEGKSIQAAIDALPKGQDPGAALEARIKAFDTKAQAAEQELGTTQQRLQSINVNILKQIKEKLDPAIRTVMTQRGANLVLEEANTLDHSPALDVTPAVIAQLNSLLTTISVAPLPQQAQPQGR